MLNTPIYRILKPGVNAPCFHCELRTEDCHGLCERYTKYRNDLTERNNAIREKNRGAILAEQFEIGEKMKNKRIREKNKRR